MISTIRQFTKPKKKQVTRSTKQYEIFGQTRTGRGKIDTVKATSTAEAKRIFSEKYPGFIPGHIEQKKKEQGSNTKSKKTNKKYLLTSFEMLLLFLLLMLFGFIFFTKDRYKIPEIKGTGSIELLNLKTTCYENQLLV